MFRIGRKATELERQKLQTEIRKEESEIRREKLEKRIQMASSRSKKGGPVKNPKKEVEEDDDFLDDLVVDAETKERKKSMTYSNLKPGGFITKAEDRKGRLDKRHARIVAASKQDEDEDDDEEETEKEQLERETRQLESDLRKAERVAEMARDQDEKEKA